MCRETRTLTCEVWGRPVDNGQRIEIEGKLTGKTALPAAITTTDPKAVSEGRIGKYSKTYKVWYAADGTEIKRDLIDTNYYPSKAPVVLCRTFAKHLIWSDTFAGHMRGSKRKR